MAHQLRYLTKHTASTDDFFATLTSNFTIKHITTPEQQPSWKHLPRDTQDFKSQRQAEKRQVNGKKGVTDEEIESCVLQRRAWEVWSVQNRVTARWGGKGGGFMPIDRGRLQLSGRLSGWRGREIELAWCHPPYTNHWTGSNGWEIERGKVEGERELEVERGGRAAKCHPNFLTSELGIMEGRREATLQGDGLREVGWTMRRGQDDREPAMIALHRGCFSTLPWSPKPFHLNPPTHTTPAHQIHTHMWCGHGKINVKRLKCLSTWRCLSTWWTDEKRGLQCCWDSRCWGACGVMASDNQ